MKLVHVLFGSVYRKLAFSLLALLVLFSAALVYLNLATTELYVEEVEQGLNRELAAHLVAEQPLLEDGVVNDESLYHVFHTLMVINPRIECYLLDPEGKLLAYNAPEGKVLVDRIDLSSVRNFLAGAQLPLRGPNPRHPETDAIFSAAPVETEDGTLAGYLYVVLAGEQYAGVADRFRRSLVLRQGLLALGVALLTAALLGLLSFRWLTRRLRRLDHQVERVDASQIAGHRFQLDHSWVPDEIDRLGETLDALSCRLGDQVRELERTDLLRRELVANVSHDLRTPVASLQGYLETLLLKEESLDETTRREYLEIALAQSERLGRLVAELFELARLDSGDLELERETFSLPELAQDVAQKFRLRAEEQRVRLETELDVSAPQVEGDLRLLERTLENLLENALRHTEDGGEVRLCVSGSDSGAQGQLRVSVADTGCGIASEDVPYIFDRFYRGRSAGKNSRPGSEAQNPGTGLGLAIAKRVVELHGSQIAVDTAVGKGTEFSFLLAASR